MSLIDKILLGAGAAVALIIAIVIVWLCLANAHLRAQLASAEETGAACRMANDDFRHEAEQQDRAIAQWQSESDARARRAAEAETAAQKIAALLQADAARIAKTGSANDDCKAAAGLLNRFIAGLK